MQLIKSIECPWYQIENKREEWEKLKQRWESEHVTKEIVKYRVKIKVLEWMPPADGWLDSGKIISFWSVKEFVESFSEIKIEELLKGKVYQTDKEEWVYGCEYYIKSFAVITLEKIVEDGGTLPPAWKLPEKPRSARPEEAMRFIQNFIKSEVPSAHWEGYFDEITDLAYREEISRIKTSEIEIEIRANKWIAKIEEELINLYYEVEIRNLDTKGMVGENYTGGGYGTWGDKGYH